MRTSQSNVRFSRAYTQSGLLRPFSDQYLLQEFSKTLEELKESQATDVSYARRLEILESQITGLLKRDLMVSGVAEGASAGSDYYLTLN